MSRFLHREGLGGGQIPPPEPQGTPVTATIATVKGSSLRLARTINGLADPVAQISAALDALNRRLSALHV